MTDPQLIELIAVALGAVIAGAKHWTKVAEFGKEKQDWFEQFLELELNRHIRPPAANPWLPLAGRHSGGAPQVKDILTL